MKKIQLNNIYVILFLLVAAVFLGTIWEATLSSSLDWDIGLAPRVVGSSLQLVAMTVMHACIILLPMLAGLLLAVFFRVQDIVLLLLIALLSGGLLAYIDFWLWVLQPKVGIVAAIVFLLLAILQTVNLLPITSTLVTDKLNGLATVALLWICYTLFLLAIGFAPTNLDNPLTDVAVRFSSALPMDNQLPYIFAQQITSALISSPMVGDWLSSDRPPLQTAFFLMSGGSLLPQSDLHYQVVATLLQNLWIVGMWLVLSVLKPGKQAIFLCLLLPMFSGFAFVHGLFTWPKLFPVIYLTTITALFLHTDKNYLSDWRIGGVAGACAALAMLCHGSSIFALLGMGLAFVFLKKIPSPHFIVCAVLVVHQ